MSSHLDLPYTKLGDITSKQPMNYCVLKLPKNKTSGQASRVRCFDEPTTSYDEAKRGKWGMLATNGPCGHRMSTERPPLRDTTFARWEITALPERCSLADALNTVAMDNKQHEGVLKYKIRFRDASELTFMRSNPDVPSSLAFSNYFVPRGAADPALQQGKSTASPSSTLYSMSAESMSPTRRHRFLVDLKGHRLGSSPTRSVRGGPKGNTFLMRFTTPAARKAIFQKLDPNGNGMLSLAELDRGVVMLWQQFNNKPAIMRAYQAADVNNTGYIGKREFKYFLTYLVHYNNLWHEFQKIDKSRDRRISLAELEANAGVLGIAKDEVRSVFQAMDVNRGGVVLFDEFAAYLSKQRCGGCAVSPHAGSTVSYGSGSSGASHVSSRVSSRGSAGRGPKVLGSLVGGADSLVGTRPEYGNEMLHCA